MKKRYIIGNIKMNLSTQEEADQYLSVLRREVLGKKLDVVNMVIVPPFVHLDRFHRELPRGIALGAQDVFWEKDGSFTGEISAGMLKGLGVEYAIVGHSERRQYGKETDEEIAEKTKALLRSNLRPILCIGESEEERRSGLTARILEQQLSIPFSGLSSMQAEKIMVAYEPRWAIGTDRIPSSEDILQARVIIYRSISEMNGSSVADRVPILYGGSVKTALLEEVCFHAQMDGVLVGRESLFPYEMVKMADRMESYAGDAFSDKNKKLV